jgi:riboflavin-specific deaminase-like protein
VRQLFPVSSSDAPAAPAYYEIQYPEPPVERPYVVLNFVLTLDGQATLGKGGAVAIGSDTDHRLMRELRASVDGLLHGAGTVRADNFPPVVSEALAQRRTARGLEPQPLGTVVTRSGNLDPNNRYFSARPPLVFAPAGPARDLEARMGTRAVIVPMDGDRAGLASMLSIMRKRFGLSTVLCEGGPRLAHGLLAERCLDEIFLTLAPKIGADRAAPRLVEGDTFLEEAAPLLDLIHVQAEGSELFLRYRIRR